MAEPDKETQRSIMYPLLERLPLQLGDKFLIVDEDWYYAWDNYVNSEDAEKPGPITCDIHNHSVIPLRPLAYENFYEWFGGPEVPTERFVERNENRLYIDIYPKKIALYTVNISQRFKKEKDILLPVGLEYSDIKSRIKAFLNIKKPFEIYIRQRQCLSLDNAEKYIINDNSVYDELIVDTGVTIL